MEALEHDTSYSTDELHARKSLPSMSRKSLEAALRDLLRTDQIATTRDCLSWWIPSQEIH